MHQIAEGSLDHTVRLWSIGQDTRVAIKVGSITRDAMAAERERLYSRSSQRSLREARVSSLACC